jgi:hypothetical protein
LAAPRTINERMRIRLNFYILVNDLAYYYARQLCVGYFGL